MKTSATKTLEKLSETTQYATPQTVEMDIVPQSSIDDAARVLSESGEVNLALLSQQEIERYKSISKDLVVTDINSISNYGSDLQNAMQRYSNDFLTAVRSQQCGEIGTLIDKLLDELDFVDIDELEPPSGLKRMVMRVPILNKLFKSVSKVLGKYDSIATNIDTISKKIAATRLTSLRDNNALQVIFENNIQYGQQVEELIIAGKLKLEEINKQLQEMQAHQDQFQPHEIQDVQEFAHNLERRLMDLMTLRYVIKQSLPQIRIVQYNNIAIANKAQSIITITIPVWKNQLSIAVALYNQKGNIEAHRKITETTNLILNKNAELLHQNSVAVAQENEKSVVSIETLRDTTAKLIQTITEVKKIHEEGSAKRKLAEAEIIKIEKQLEEGMTSAQNTQLYIGKV